MMKRFVILVAGMAVGLGAAVAHAQPTQPAPDDAAKHNEWARTMHETKLPKKGCFQATYPATTWTEVACKKAPNIPLAPTHGARPTTIGNGNSVAAQVTATITQATGKFDVADGIVSVATANNSGGTVNGAYSLQLNTSYFAASLCTGAGANCLGWQQFIYLNDGTAGSVYTQYWLLHYNKTCPATWTEFLFTGDTDIYCYRQSAAGSPPAQAITSLASLKLTGTANGTAEAAVLDNGTTMFAAAGDDSLSLASSGHWKAAEFNVFGAGADAKGGFQAQITGNGTVAVHLQPHIDLVDGSPTAPLCSAEGYTGETNNLMFGSPAPTMIGTTPALLFNEASNGTVTTACSAATSVGDTHLSTIAGLLYDFQAAGDFVLADAGKDFIVQARQVSGAPNWPSASINQAVAARLGDTTVAVCLADGGARVLANGKPIEFGQAPQMIGKDVTATRVGNTSYMFTSASGNSLRADVNPTHINVYLGFGSSAATVKGLIANANANVNQLAGLNGNVIANPFDFDALYHKFGDSWRVSGQASLLSACGEAPTAANPVAPFTPNDLPPEVRKNAEAACTTAKVKVGPLFDACTIDVAFTGKNTAADVYTGMADPTAVGTIKAGHQPPPPPPPPHHRPWWLWLLVGVALALIVFLFARRKRP